MTDSLVAVLLLVLGALVAYGVTFGAVTWLYLSEERRQEPSRSPAVESAPRHEEERRAA